MGVVIVVLKRLIVSGLTPAVINLTMTLYH